MLGFCNLVEPILSVWFDKVVSEIVNFYHLSFLGCFKHQEYISNHGNLLRKDKLISDVLLWTPTHGCTSIGWLARTYLHQLCVDTGCSLEDLPGVMDDRDGWRESGKSILLAWLDDDISKHLVFSRYAVIIFILDRNEMTLSLFQKWNDILNHVLKTKLKKKTYDERILLLQTHCNVQDLVFVIYSIGQVVSLFN